MRKKSLSIIGNNLPSLEKTGQLSRLTDYYLQYYTRRFDRIYIFSERSDSAVPDYDGKCIVIEPYWKMPSLLYQFFLPFVHKEFRKCDLIRVMHMNCVIPAVLAKLFWKIPYVATYGYDYAEMVWMGRRSKWLLSLKYLYVKVVIKLGLKFAKRILVTAPEVFNKLRQEILPSRIFYSPNGVDTTRFINRKVNNEPSSSLLCIFVGRLELEKNLFMLLDALALLHYLPIRLTLIGDGSLREDLKEYALKKRIQVEFAGVKLHHELPESLCQHHVFVLPSLQEGHPKALLEAMCCGLACLGSNVPGINSLICHGKTGLLSDLTPESFAEALSQLYYNKTLREKLGQQAQKFIRQHFDLNILLQKESVFLSDMVVDRA